MLIGSIFSDIREFLNNVGPSSMLSDSLKSVRDCTYTSNTTSYQERHNNISSRDPKVRMSSLGGDFERKPDLGSA